MKPCVCPSVSVPLIVGSGGDEEVNVVANRVGLNRFEEA
jgi:hypothetical protein